MTNLSELKQKLQELQTERISFQNQLETIAAIGEPRTINEIISYPNRLQELTTKSTSLRQVIDFLDKNIRETSDEITRMNRESELEASRKRFEQGSKKVEAAAEKVNKLSEELFGALETLHSTGSEYQADASQFVGKDGLFILPLFIGQNYFRIMRDRRSWYLPVVEKVGDQFRLSWAQYLIGGK